MPRPARSAHLPIDRRAALGQLALASGALALGVPQAAEASPNDQGGDVTFYVVADPQVHLDKWGTAGTEATIRTINALPGTEFPLGGVVAPPRAVLVAGDLVDAVDDPRHWEAYCRMFDPHGDALLKFRTLECIGNHDLSAESADDWSVVQRAYIERNRSRQGPETFFYDEHHYHYAWDWGPLHLVNLNLFPGNEPRPVYDRPSPWNNPRRSLDFLREDLRTQVAASGRPIVLMWHYGLRGWGLEKWWLPEDLANLKEAIAPYNVALILHGHEHAFAQYEWEGYPVFMCPSPQRDRNPETPEVDSAPKGFLVVRLQGHELQLAHRTDRGWAETWSRTLDF
jgi:hypothetical protein